MLKEDVSGRLRGVDADTVVGDDGRGGWRDLELLVSSFVFGFFCFFEVEKKRERNEGKKSLSTFLSSLTSSAAYLSTAVNGAASGTLNLSKKGGEEKKREAGSKNLE